LQLKGIKKIIPSDRPYFLHNGDLYPLDYEFALGKLENAVVWRVLWKLPKNK